MIYIVFLPSEYNYKNIKICEVPPVGVRIKINHKSELQNASFLNKIA